MNSPKKENTGQVARLRIRSTLPLSYCLVSIAFGAFLGCHRNETAFRSPTSTDSTVDGLKPTAASTCTVTIKVDMSGFVNDRGVSRVAVYLNPSHFNDPEYAVAKGAIDINDLKASWQVELRMAVQPEQSNEDLTRIAVCAYHDENENSTLDKNSFGIPSERYGFSNNPKRGFGPPKFNEAAIEFIPSIDFSDANKVFEFPILVK